MDGRLALDDLAVKCVTVKPADSDRDPDQPRQMPEMGPTAEGVEACISARG